MSSSKVDKIYEDLRKDLISFKYQPGVAINEKAIAESYGVSKTPAREALNRLVEADYLIKVPRLGYFVHEINETEYYKLLYLRLTLEKAVASYIIANCQDEQIDSLKQYCTQLELTQWEYAAYNMRFHIGMAQLTDNEYLISSLRNVMERMVRMPSNHLYQIFSKNPNAKHLQLIECLKRRNAEEVFEFLRNECRRDDDKELWF